MTGPSEAIGIPEVYKSLLTLIAARLRETDATVAGGSFLPLRGRVARTLLELAQEFGLDVGTDRIVIHQKIGQSEANSRLLKVWLKAWSNDIQRP